MNIYLIIIALISIINASFVAQPAKNVILPPNILKIDYILNDRYAAWDANNIISVYGSFPTWTYQFNLSLTDYLISVNFNPTQIKTDLDGYVMVGVFSQSVCWVNFLNNRTGCDHNITLNTSSIATDFQFIDKFMNVVIGTNANYYIIANLLTGAKTFLSTSISLLTFTNFRNKIYCITNSSLIQVMDLNSSSLNYLAFVNSFNNTFDILIQKKMLKGVYLDGRQILLISQLNMIYGFHIQSGTFLYSLNLFSSIKDFRIIDGTLITTTAQSIYQSQLTNNMNLQSLPLSLNSMLIISNSVFISVNKIYFFIYSKNKTLTSSMFVYYITQGMSACNISNQLYCSLCILPTVNNTCVFCEKDFYLSSNLSCQSTNCLPYQKFNYVLSVCENVCKITQIYIQSINRCDCSSGLVFDQILNQCQISCDDVNCQNCYISSFCTSCNVGYSLNMFGQCLALNNASTPLPTPNTTYTNISCQATNCLRCQSTNSQKCIQCIDQSIFYLNSNGQCLKYSNLSFHEIISEIKNISTYPLSIPSFKTLFKSSLYLFFFLDDYWYYIYHDIQYKQEVKFVFQMIKEANQQTLVPQFIDFSQVKRKIQPKLFMTSHYEYYTPEKVKEADQSSIQFLQRTHQMYVYDYGGSILLFFIMKIIALIIQKIYAQRQKGILNSMYLYIVEFSNLKTLFISLFESCAVYISFNCSLQLLTPSYFMIMDKFSLVIGHFFFFVIIIYSLCFYLVIYGVQLRKEAQVYLNFSTYSLSGFINEAVLNAIRNLFNGFFHGYFIYSCQIQFLLLIIIKVFIIISILKFRKNFQSKSLLVMFLFYFMIGIILDTLFGLNYFLQNLQNNFLGLVQAIMLGILLFITLFMFLGDSIISFGKLFKKNCLKNKIQPQANEKKQTSHLKKIQLKDSLKKNITTLKFTNLKQIQLQDSKFESSQSSNQNQKSSQQRRSESQSSNQNYDFINENNNKFDPYSVKSFSIYKIQYKNSSQKTNFEFQSKQTKTRTNIKRQKINERYVNQHRNSNWNKSKTKKLKFLEKENKQIFGNLEKQQNFSISHKNYSFQSSQLKFVAKSNAQIKNENHKKQDFPNIYKNKRFQSQKIKEDPQTKRRNNINALNITFVKSAAFVDQFLNCIQIQ